MNNAIKGIILMAIIVYALSPIDLAPGPIDDLIVIAVGLAGQKALASISSDSSTTTIDTDESDDDYTFYY